MIEDSVEVTCKKCDGKCFTSKIHEKHIYKIGCADCRPDGAICPICVPPKEEKEEEKGKLG